MGLCLGAACFWWLDLLALDWFIGVFAGSIAIGVVVVVVGAAFRGWGNEDVVGHGGFEWVVLAVLVRFSCKDLRASVIRRSCWREILAARFSAGLRGIALFLRDYWLLGS